MFCGLLKVFSFFLSLSVLPDFPLMNLGQWTLQVGSCPQGVLRWRWGKDGEGRLQVPQAQWAGGGALSLGLPRIPPSLSTELLSPARAWPGGGLPRVSWEQITGAPFPKPNCLSRAPSCAACPVRGS